MKKTNVRICAILLAGVIAVLAFATVMQIPEAAALSEKPEFSFVVSTDSVNSGDNIIVTFIVKNDTDKTLTSFHGSFAYNSEIFRVADTTLLNDMKVKVNSEEIQTVSVDKTSNTSGSMGFTFADTTGTLLTAGKEVPFLSVTLKTVGKAGVGQITGSILSCYSGDISFGMINIVQKTLTVQTTTTTAPVTVTQSNLSADARLSSLQVTSGELMPAFNPEFVAYTVNVGPDIASVRISATPSSSKAIVTGEGVKELVAGLNSFTITVTAENGAIMQYGVIINRAEAVENATVVIDSVSGSDEQAVIVETTSTETTTTTSATQVVSIGDSGQSKEGFLSSGDGMLKLLLIIVGEIALFVFGFLAGYFIDKNLKRKAILEMQLNDVGLRMQQFGAEDAYDDEYDEQYEEEYEEQFNQYGIQEGVYSPPQPPEIAFGDYGYNEEDDYYN